MGTLIGFIGWTVGAIVNTLVGLGGVRNAQEEHPTRSDSSFLYFLNDILKRVHQFDTRRQPRIEPLRGWMLVADRGVSLPAPNTKRCCSVRVESEIRTGEPFWLLARVKAYFEETGNIPGATCLLYAVQGQAKVAELREVQEMYPDLSIVVAMTSIDPDNVAEMRALHSSWTSLVGLVVLPHETEDVQSFLEAVLAHL